MDVRKFFIKPKLPQKISALQEMAFNVWSCWDQDAQRLFHRLDPQLFRRVSHNPVELLYRLDGHRLEDVAKDNGFLYELNQVHEKFEQYMNYEGTYVVEGGDKPFSQDELIAYICMEYGLHESLPIYSGGLAVLAGDQLKAMSDVGCPVVSFGLLYRHGYFNQRITAEGDQVEEYRENTWYLSPVTEVMDGEGKPLFIKIPLKGKSVAAKIWKIQVGRVPLYMLDTNVQQNPEEFKKITNMLYDSDRATRIEQELILGRGSIIALKALGIEPKVYHLNEGHTAFAILQRLIDLKSEGHSMEEAKSIIRCSTLFTTHTPVAAGNEHFDDDLIKLYLREEVSELGLTMDEFLSLGKIAKEKNFWLPAFALRYSRKANGVSKIHASVSRDMWRNLYPSHHQRELPIDAVTNGIHLQSWLSLQMTELFNRYIGPDYLHTAENSALWEKIKDIPDGEIWNAHRRRKEQVISFIRRRIARAMNNQGYCKHKIRDVEGILNPAFLTIGFARRFAQYKRGALILKDPDRLAAILTNTKRPVQLVFSGKAHPADGSGKDIIKRIVDFISDYPVENHVVFIEDYDINVARHLVQGVDVWLNTPQRPMEASGTSGMKAAVNGILNFSILDGWWPEAYDGENGWAITAGSVGTNPEMVDDAEAYQLYEILESQIAELFYSREEGDIPLEWVRMMKNSIASVSNGFNMHRTVREYLYKAYLPQADMTKRLMADHSFLLKGLTKKRKEIDVIWPNVYIRDYFTSINGRVPISGEEVNVDCYVYLDNANQSQIAVEAFYCHGEDFEQHVTIPLEFVEKYPDRVAKYSGKFHLKGTGLQELSVRMTPADKDFREIYPEYAKWK